MIVCLQTINQIIVALYLFNHDITSKATIDLLIVALLLYYVIYIINLLIVNLLIVFMQTNVMAYHICVNCQGVNSLCRNNLYVNSETWNNNSRYCVILCRKRIRCQTSFSPLCQVLHEKFTILYGSIFAAVFTCMSVCIILVVWAFRRLDGWESAG